MNTAGQILQKKKEKKRNKKHKPIKRTWADHVSGVYRFTGAGMQPGGGPRLIAGAQTERGRERRKTPVTPPGRKTPAHPANSRQTETDDAGGKALIIALTWWRRPCRPCRHRKTSVQVRCPAREAPPWSGLKSYFISFPLHGVSRELSDHR